MVKKFLYHFIKKEFQKANKEKFRIKKLIKRKGNKRNVKWKGYDNSFNCWTEKKRHGIK